MNTNPIGLFNVFQSVLGGEDFQTFIDRYAEKYNNIQIDGFGFKPTQIGYTFAQVVSESGAQALPTWVDPESPGYEAVLKKMQGATGNIPTMKRYYRLNRTVMNEQLQLLQRFNEAALPGMRETVMGLIDESTDGLIQSYYNALTHMRMQLVSTGSFALNETNNPRGLDGVTITFNIPSGNADDISSTSGKKWWSNSGRGTETTNSKPLDYLRNRVKSIRKDKHYEGPLRMEMSKSLWDDMLNHTEVVSRLAAYFFPTAATASYASAAVADRGDEAIKAAVARIVQVDEIAIRDTYAYVDAPGTDSDGNPDLVQTQISNFKGNVVSFIPTGNIGMFHGVSPIALGYDNDKFAYFDGGRLLMTHRAEPKTHSLYIESEAAQIAVPSVPQHIFISTVTP